MLKRLSNLFRGFFGLFVSDIERKNPEALLELETENLRKQIAQYNQGLITHAALCERLMAQVRTLETTQRDLRSKITANLNAGNRDLAGEYAVRLQTAERELDDARNQLAQAETTYQNLIRTRDTAVSAARQRLEALRSKISDMKMRKAMADLTEMASGMASNIGGSNDTLDRLTSMVDDERAKASGRIRVARDNMAATTVPVNPSEQKALNAQALAEFESRETLALNPAAPQGSLPAASTKALGPGSRE